MKRSSKKFCVAVTLAAAAALTSFNCTAAARAWTYTYNADGQVRSVNGPRTDVEDVTTYTYNSAGNRVRTTNAFGHMSLMGDYDNHGRPGKITDANGIQTELSYHPRGWLQSSTLKDPGGDSAQDAITHYHYDHEGQLTNTIFPDGSSISYEYDAAHRLTAISNSLGERIEYTLDDLGNHLSETTRAADGTATRVLSRNFDEMGRTITITGASGQTTRYTYDRNGNRTNTLDAGLNTTSESYDELNRLTGSVAPLNRSVNYEHDAQNNVKQVTDPRSLATTYTFDGLGNLTRQDSPDTGITTYSYDEAGNRLRQEDARGIVTEYAYDALDRLTTVTYPAEPLKNIIYSYDNWFLCSSCTGRLNSIKDASGLTAYAYDHHGQVTIRANNVNIPDGTVVNLNTYFFRDSAGRLTAIEYPNGQTVRFDFDSAAQVAAIYRVDPTLSIPEAVLNDVNYQPFGRVLSSIYGNGLRMTRSFDLDGRLIIQQIAGLQSLVYEYDALDNIKAINNQFDPERDRAYSYDALNQLTISSGKSGVYSYGYDATGNRTTRNWYREGSSTSEIYTYDTSSNHLENISSTRDSTTELRSFQYDAKGNMVNENRNDGSRRRPHYDATNRMDRISP